MPFPSRSGTLAIHFATMSLPHPSPTDATGPLPFPRSSRGFRRPLGAAVATFALVAPAALAQYAPPAPPAPFAGFLNEELRRADPDLKVWDISGAARVRYEVKDGNGIAGVPGSIDFRENNADNHNAYFLERFRLHAAYTDTWWGVFAEGRSSLAQGDERYAFSGTPLRKGNGPESDTLDLHQAYATIGNSKEFPLSLKVGRQEISYADERFIGAFGWNNIGRVFDAAKLQWKNDWFTTDFFTARPVIPVDGTFNVSNDYEWFSGAYATSPLVPKHQLDVYALSRNVTPDSPTAVPNAQVGLPSARDIYTLGVRLKSKPGEFGPWDYTVDVAGQFGNFRDTRSGAPTYRLEHEAYAVVLNGGYTFKDVPTTPRVAIEYALGSGDSNSKNGTHGTFDNLYPTNHKFYGYADFASLQNLHDVRAILQCRPLTRMNVALETHWFWLAETTDNFYNVTGAPRGGTGATPGTGYGVNPSYGNYLGSEVDLVAGYALTRYAQIEGGYAHFFTGDYIDQSLSNPAFGSRDANWLYLQVNLNF